MHQNGLDDKILPIPRHLLRATPQHLKAAVLGAAKALEQRLAVPFAIRPLCVVREKNEPPREKARLEKSGDGGRKLRLVEHVRCDHRVEEAELVRAARSISLCPVEDRG